MLADNVPKKVKAKRLPRRTRGPVAPKPSGVFAEPIGKVSVGGKPKPATKSKPPAKPKVTRSSPSALDVLPAKAGKRPTPYKPPVAEKVVRKAEHVRAAAQHEARDTKSDGDRRRAAAFLDAHPEILHPKPKRRGSLLATITGAAKLGQKGTELASDAAGTAAPYAAAVLAPAITGTLAGVDKATGSSSRKLASKVVSNAARDLVDIPANAVPSLYRSVDTAIHDPEKAAKELAQPYIDLVKHPGKSLAEHPVGSALLFAGGEGAAGRGAGKLLRSAPSQRLRAIGATAREVESPGNIAAVAHKPYSKNVTHKAVRVSLEKVKARRARKQGQPAPRATMSKKDIERRVDETVAVGRTVAGHNEAKAQKAAKKALGKKPSAATSAIAQGLTDGTVADLQALVGRYRSRAATLSGDSLKRNQDTVAALEDALQSHDPAKAVEAAKAYSDVRAPGEAETVARGFVKPEVAEATRMAGVAVRRHDIQTGAEAPKTVRRAAKDERTVAAKGAKKARRVVGAAAKDFEKAYANARVSVAQPKATAELRAAETVRRTARTKVARLQRQHKGADRPVTYSAQMRVARQAARDADKRVAAIRSRLRGVAPAQADALLKAIAVRDDARAGAAAASAGAKKARRAHVDVKTGIKNGAYVGPDGKLIPLTVVRGSKGPVEPVYVSHSPTGDVRPAAVPTEPPTVAVREARTGKALDEGAIDLRPDRLIQQAGDSQRRLDAAKNYDRFLEEFSHRKTKDARSPEVYGNEGTADAAAMTLKDGTGIDWVKARTFEGNYQMVPKAAAERLAAHAAHSDNLMGAFTRQWSKNVLAFSPRWLAGQAIEPVVRATVAHAGPRSMVTGVKVARRIKNVHGEEVANQFKASTMSSGLQRAAMAPLEHVGARKEYTGLAKVVRELPKKPGPKQLGQVYNAVTNFTMGTLNHLVQNPSQYAMLGKAIRDSDLMSEHTVKLSSAAIDDFVRNGGKDINVMSALGREVTRMNGKYSGFSPKVQAAIAGYTPFLAWTLSATNFLFNVMPRDHPVLTSLIASSNQATEGWRKANGLSFDPFAAGQEGWLQGSIPGKDGSHLRVGRYVPFGLADDDLPVVGPYLEAVLPQAMGILAAGKEGEDFTGRSLVDGAEPSAGRKVAAAGSLFLRGVVPLASQILAVGGIRTPDMADSAKIKPQVKARLRAQFDPFMYTPGKSGGSSGGGTGGPLPPGVSQRELDALISEAQEAATAQPAISRREIDALIREQLGR